MNMDESEDFYAVCLFQPIQWLLNPKYYLFLLWKKYRCVCLNRTRRLPGKCPIYSRFRLTRAQFQSTCTDSSPEKCPVYDGFRFKSVRFNQTHLHICIGLKCAKYTWFSFENGITAFMVYVVAQTGDDLQCCSHEIQLFWHALILSKIALSYTYIKTLLN